MIKYILIAALMGLALAGCEKQSSSSSESVDAIKKGSSTNTAIYLPGGGGIDFGLLPTKDVSGEKGPDGRSSRSITYLLDAKIDEVVDALNDVLGEQGYKHDKQQSASQDQLYYYTKPGAHFAVAFNEKVQEGLVKKTSIMIWYWEEK